jgi:hypothetical protein
MAHFWGFSGTPKSPAGARAMLKEAFHPRDGIRGAFTLLILQIKPGNNTKGSACGMPPGRTLCRLITLLNAGYSIGSPPHIPRNVLIQTNMIDYYTSAWDAGNLPLQQGFHTGIRDLTV